MTIQVYHTKHSKFIATLKADFLPMQGDEISLVNSKFQTKFVKVIKRLFISNTDQVSVYVEDANESFPFILEEELSKKEIEELDADLEFESVTPALDNAIGFDKYSDRTAEVVTERCFSLPTKKQVA